MATEAGRRMVVGSYRAVTLVALRILGAGLLGAMAGIHLYLWTQGYQDVPTIGPLFLLNGIIGALLTIGVLAAPTTPVTLLPAVAAAATLFTAGTLGALVLSLTVGLFGFVESLATPLVPSTIGVEAAGVLVLAALAGVSFARGSAAD
ncbi:MAG TPA: hypothetical protein VG317_03235 [Pseudonocardiaceae bacterium]|nr:hypothetical protein [Pseudonocardiaceae bacterium]